MSAHLVAYVVFPEDGPEAPSRYRLIRFPRRDGSEGLTVEREARDALGGMGWRPVKTSTEHKLVVDTYALKAGLAFERIAEELVVERDPGVVAEAVVNLSKQHIAFVQTTDEPRDVAEPEVLHDLLSLVMDEGMPPVTAIKRWTPERCAEAERWAAAVHLWASDNDDVLVPDQPAWLVEGGPWCEVCGGYAEVPASDEDCVYVCREHARGGDDA